MKISGFTFVRNAVVFGYPFIESLNSLLPLCDEIIVAAGKSNDNTIEILHNLNNPKIKIIETVWDEELKRGGLVYSQQTNLALDACSGDWCVYLQADEVLHEEDYDLFYAEILKADERNDIESLLFKYLHFYGSYDYIGVGRQWYKREIRAFKNSGNIISVGDAQGFRKIVNNKHQKIKAKQTDIRVFHYGWVRQPSTQQLKLDYTQSYYKGTETPDIERENAITFDYSNAFELSKYEGSQPSVMAKKIKQDNTWTRYFDAMKMRKKPFLVKISDYIESKTGLRIGEFKDFIEVK